MTAGQSDSTSTSLLSASATEEVLSADDLQDDQLVDGDEDAEDADESGSEAGADDAPQDPKDKRIRDLMSNWQKEQAKVTRLEAQLARRNTDAGDDSAPAQGAPAADEGFNEILRESAREALYKSDPRLAKFGFKPDVITGATAEEMKQSLASQKAFLDAVEGKVRNEVLAEHGLTNDAAGGSAESPQDYASMSSEDFAKLVSRVKDGG